MKTFVPVLFLALLLGGASVPAQAEAASKTKGLASSVYVTPLGTPIIRPPAGWTATVLIDEPPKAYVFFTNPEKTVSFQVGVGHGYSEADTSHGQTERIINLYGGTGTFDGKKLSGKVVKNKPVRIGIAGGFDLEMKRTDLSGKSVIRHIVVDTVGPDYTYLVAAKVPEKHWKKYKTVLESSFKTLQIPKSFTLLKPHY